MPKSENQKLKTLYVAKFFMENSDENHSVSASDIIDYLREECSVEAERRSIYSEKALSEMLKKVPPKDRRTALRLLSVYFESLM